MMQNPEALELENTAHHLLKEGKITQAKEMYEKSLAVDHTSLRARFGLAQVLQQMGEYEQALIHLQACVDYAPKHPSFLFQSGASYLQLGNVDAAKIFFQKALQFAPQHIEALVNLGICFLREKDYSHAIYYFSTACRIDENHLPAQFNLACCLLEAKKFFQARDYFQRYCERAPDDLEAVYHLGFVNMILEELTEAENLFQKILNVNTQHVLGMHNMASIALKRREPSVALGYYQRILSVDPHDEIARYMEAALTQKNPPAHAPQKYVKALFDQYAANFDQHLKEVLHYQAPQHLYVLWKKCFADKSITILDLGCGTGLMGELFKPHAKKLVGVDISSEMIKIARKKKSYDALHEADILEFLENCQEKFDLIILADVLVYFGDLKPLFKSLQKTAGRLLFSIETTKKSPFELTATGRYQHSVENILSLAKAHQFRVEKYETIVLRQQAHQEAKGAVFLFSYIY